MAISKANFTRETTTTSGTSDYELGGATDQYQTFLSGIGDGNSCYYACFSNADFEVGKGTLTAGSPDVLSRDTIIESTNSDAKVNWPASGTRTIILVNAAEKNAEFDENDDLNLLRDLILARHVLLGTTTTNIQGQSGVAAIVDFINGGGGGTIEVRRDGNKILDVTDKATQNDAETENSVNKYMDPQRVGQAIDVQAMRNDPPVTTGTSSEYEVTMPLEGDSLIDGTLYSIRPHTDSAASGVTIDITPTGGTALGAKDIVTVYNTNPEEAALKEGKTYWLKYVSSNDTFILINPSIFEDAFESTEFTIGNGVTLSSGHGLGGVPKNTAAFLRCKTAELGYSVGEEVKINDILVASAGKMYGATIYASSTIIGVMTGNDGFVVVARSGVTAGDWTVIDDAKWRVVLRAWR